MHPYICIRIVLRFRIDDNDNNNNIAGRLHFYGGILFAAVCPVLNNNRIEFPDICILPYNNMNPIHKILDNVHSPLFEF